MLTIDVLVNNVGIATPRSGFLDISEGEWQRVFNLTFFNAVRARVVRYWRIYSFSRGAISTYLLEVTVTTPKANVTNSIAAP